MRTCLRGRPIRNLCEHGNVGAFVEPSRETEAAILGGLSFSPPELRRGGFENSDQSLILQVP